MDARVDGRGYVHPLEATKTIRGEGARAAARADRRRIQEARIDWRALIRCEEEDRVFGEFLRERF